MPPKLTLTEDFFARVKEPQVFTDLFEVLPVANQLVLHFLFGRNVGGSSGNPLECAVGIKNGASSQANPLHRTLRHQQAQIARRSAT